MRESGECPGTRGEEGRGKVNLKREVEILLLKVTFFKPYRK